MVTCAGVGREFRAYVVQAVGDVEVTSPRVGDVAEVPLELATPPPRYGPGWSGDAIGAPRPSGGEGRVTWVGATDVCEFRMGLVGAEGAWAGTDVRR